MEKEHTTEDADFALTGKRKECTENSLSNSNEPMGYWEAINQTSSIYDLYDQDAILDEVNNGVGFEKEKPSMPNPYPYIAIKDLNNSPDKPNENKPKTAIEIGLKFEF